MEDVLGLYAEGYGSRRPQAYFDEMFYQLVKEKPLPGKPGQPARFDYEYVRAGTHNLFMSFVPHGGLRHVEVMAHAPRRTFGGIDQPVHRRSATNERQR